jgi:hypothetical protein
MIFNWGISVVRGAAGLTFGWFFGINLLLDLSLSSF